MSIKRDKLVLIQYDQNPDKSSEENGTWWDLRLEVFGYKANVTDFTYISHHYSDDINSSSEQFVMSGAKLQKLEVLRIAHALSI